MNRTILGLFLIAAFILAVFAMTITVADLIERMIER